MSIRPVKSVSLIAMLALPFSVMGAQSQDYGFDPSLSGDYNTHTSPDATTTIQPKGESYYQNTDNRDAIYVDGTHDESASSYDSGSKYDNDD